LMAILAVGQQMGLMSCMQRSNSKVPHTNALFCQHMTSLRHNRHVAAACSLTDKAQGNTLVVRHARRQLVLYSLPLLLVNKTMRNMSCYNTQHTQVVMCTVLQTQSIRLTVSTRRHKHVAVAMHLCDPRNLDMHVERRICSSWFRVVNTATQRNP
jgi:hypothetical protein